jgi:hypothetical protein
MDLFLLFRVWSEIVGIKDHGLTSEIEFVGVSGGTQ